MIENQLQEYQVRFNDALKKTKQITYD